MNNARLRNVAFEDNCGNVKSLTVDKVALNVNLNPVENTHLKIINQQVSETNSALKHVNYQMTQIRNSKPMDSTVGVVSNIQNVQLSGMRNPMDISTPPNPFRDLDEAFSTLRYKMKTTGVQQCLTNDSEKLKFSRAINLIFKNNLHEIHVRDIKILVNNGTNFGKNGESIQNMFLHKSEKSETVMKNLQGGCSSPINSHKINEIINANNLMISPTVSNNSSKATISSDSSTVSHDSGNKSKPINAINSLNLLKDLKTNSFLPPQKNINGIYPGQDNNSKKIIFKVIK
jgi:hypothetical protein